MKRKQYLVVLALLMGTMVFAGCNKNNQASTQQGQEQTQEDAKVPEYNVEDYVQLGEYKGVKVQYPAAGVSEDDVASYIQDVIDENTEYVEVTDRAAAEGDNVNIDFTGKIDGEEFEGGSETEYDLELGTGDFLEEFEKNLVGVKIGETVTFSVTFPEDYWDEAVIGKKAEFSVTVNSIQEIVVPEYNDAFVSEMTDYATMAEYEEAVEKELLAESEAESMSVAGEDALSMAVEAAEIKEYPQELYDSCKAEVEETYQFYAEMFEMEYDAFINEYIGEEGLEEEITGLVNETLVVEAIAKKEGLAVTDYAADAAAMASEYEYESLEEFEEEYGKEYIQSQLLRNKVVSFLYSTAVLEEVPYDEYYGEEEEVTEEGTEETEEAAEE